MDLNHLILNIYILPFSFLADLKSNRGTLNRNRVISVKFGTPCHCAGSIPWSGLQVGWPITFLAFRRRPPPLRNYDNLLLLPPLRPAPKRAGCRSPISASKNALDTGSNRFYRASTQTGIGTAPNWSTAVFDTSIE